MLIAMKHFVRISIFKLLKLLLFSVLIVLSPYVIGSTRENPVISGNVYLLPGSNGFEHVTLSFSGIGQTLTDDDGYYEMEVPQGWNGIVNP